MLPELDYKSAPSSQLQTWSGVVKFFVVSTICVTVILLLMAAFLL